MDAGNGWRAFLSQHLDGLFAVVAGLLLVIAWYLPWFTMSFPAANPPSAPLRISPAALTRDPAATHDAWFLLVVGVIILLLGASALFRQRMVWRDALWQSVAGALLLASVWTILGQMAVLQTFMGLSAPGVHLIPQPGALLVVLACACVVSAAAVAWHQARGRDR